MVEFLVTVVAIIRSMKLTRNEKGNQRFATISWQSDGHNRWNKGTKKNANPYFGRIRVVTTADLREEDYPSAKAKSEGIARDKVVVGTLWNGKAEHIEGLEAVDPRTVRIRLERPFGPFLSHLVVTTMLASAVWLLWSLHRPQSLTAV